MFKNILNTCSQSIFVYNGQVLKQVDGVPLLANWFVSKLDTGLLSKNEPKMYTRYVDVIFTKFFNQETANEFN